MIGIDVGRLEVEDKDLPGSPNWAARFTILEGDPDGQFAIRTDPKTNEGVLSVVKVKGVHGPPAGVSLWAELMRAPLLTPWDSVWTLSKPWDCRLRPRCPQGDRATHKPACYSQHAAASCM